MTGVVVAAASAVLAGFAVGVVVGVVGARHWVRIVAWCIRLDRWGVTEQRQFLRELAKPEGEALIREQERAYLRSISQENPAVPDECQHERVVTFTSDDGDGTALVTWEQCPDCGAIRVSAADEWESPLGGGDA
jgi:hypothetical protein